jgi:uncharacterized C2H2 Zn-finger protein
MLFPCKVICSFSNKDDAKSDWIRNEVGAETGRRRCRRQSAFLIFADPLYITHRLLSFDLISSFVTVTSIFVVMEPQSHPDQAVTMDKCEVSCESLSAGQSAIKSEAEGQMQVAVAAVTGHRPLTELNYWRFGSADLTLDFVTDQLAEYIKSNDWKYSDTSAVQHFHTALIAAATRSDLLVRDMRIGIPDTILKALKKLYYDCWKSNSDAYNRIINDPAILNMFQDMRLAASSGMMTLTQSLYESDFSFIYLLHIYIAQPVANEALFTTDFVQQVCRSILTILMEYKSQDMGVYRSDFVAVIRPALKLMLRDVVRGIYWKNLTEIDQNRVMREMPLWFWEEGKLAVENTLSLELDVIGKELDQAIEISDKAISDKESGRKRKNEERDHRRQMRNLRKAGITVGTGDVRGIPVPVICRHPVNEEDLMKCDKCPQYFANQVDLISHVMKHYGKGKFGCPLCNFKSMSQGVAKAHIQCHAIDEKIRAAAKGMRTYSRTKTQSLQSSPESAASDESVQSEESDMSQ